MRLTNEEPAATPAIPNQIVIKNIPAPLPPENPENEQQIKPEPRSYQEYRPKRHSCAKFFGCFLIVALLILGSVAYLVIYVAGPIVKTVDALPADFPQQLAVYQLNDAKIKVQDPESKKEVLQLLDSVPSWLLGPFLNYLTADLRTQVAAGLQDPKKLSKDINLSDLQKVLHAQTTPTKTVTLSWQSLDQTKENLLDYYKNKFQAEGFTVSSNLSDYGIDLDFFKTGISGAMSIADSFMKNQSSILNMTINYPVAPVIPVKTGVQPGLNK